MNKLVPLVIALLAAFQLSGCAAAVGAGAVVVADKILEEENGDDGLF